MISTAIQTARRDTAGGYKVDAHRGQRIGRAASEWFSRPDDQRFLSLSDLYQNVHNRAARSRTRVIESSPQPFIAGVGAACERIVARNDEERGEFLRKRGFGKAETARIIDTVFAEEGRSPESVFDFVQGITAVARGKSQLDARLDLETRAKRVFELAA
jgi:hypothetical protein